MERESEDIDIAVTSPPTESLRLAEGAGLKAIPTGLDHGVITVIVDGAPFEVATLRRDVATDGRRAVVAYTDQITEDAARRDFTMNALYADGDGSVLDPLGEGLADLAARRLRFIGDAQQRIEEDFLRILRFFRFHAQFGVTSFDEVGRKACLKARDGLNVISAERIGAEFRKLLTAPDPGPALCAMGAILTDILPGARWPENLIRSEADWSLAPDAMRRLVALAPTSVIRLRLSKAEIARRDRISAAQNLPVSEAAYRLGAAAATDAQAIIGASVDDLKALIARASCATFPLSASDLMERGIPPGPALGTKLKELEARWIEADFRLGKEALLGGHST